MTEPEPAANPQAYVTEEMVEELAGVLWDDGASHDPTYMFPSREARYRAARIALTTACALSRPAAERGQIVEEEIARAIWENQRIKIRDQDGLNARLTWNSNTVPMKFWGSYRDDARAAIRALSPASAQTEE